ncbi:MAG: class I SAM-dependent methyltransferase [Acidimicrobiales bacterium]
MPSTTRPDLPVPEGLRRGAHRDRKEWMASARFATDLLARTAGRDRLEGIEMLDVGCGTKLTKALLDDGWPIGRYVGVDVSQPVAHWLQANVADQRFTFHHLDARNDLYNPTGAPLDEIDRLPVGDRPFDLICLFSVFTHLAPSDYVAMLRLLLPHVKPDGRLLFSLFLKDPRNRVALALEQALASADPQEVQRANDRITGALGQGGPLFVDEVPETPLLRARYNRGYALSLVAEGGWAVEALHPPERHIQNFMICRPASVLAGHGEGR